MKKYISMFAFVLVTALAVQSCGNDTKKTPEAPQTTQEAPATEKKAETPVAEEVKTEVKAENATEDVVVEKKATGLADKKYTKPIEGKIVSLTGLEHGKTSINKADAKKMVEKAVPLMFMPDAGGICMVYNADGSYAGKNLAKYAANTKIGIIGQVKTVSGIKIIIADKIESMD